MLRSCKSVLGLSAGKDGRRILVSEVLSRLDETERGIRPQLREAALAVPIIQRIPFAGYLCPETADDESEATTAAITVVTQFDPGFACSDTFDRRFDPTVSNHGVDVCVGCYVGCFFKVGRSNDIRRRDRRNMNYRFRTECYGAIERKCA